MQHSRASNLCIHYTFKVQLASIPRQVQQSTLSITVDSIGGLPIGAVLLKQSIADIMNVGDHGSTFAGNPLVCHAAEAVVDIITEEGFLDEVARKGNKLRDDLQTVLKGNPHVQQVRGLGLIVGVQLDVVCVPSIHALQLLNAFAKQLVSTCVTEANIVLSHSRRRTCKLHINCI